jgi:hypothetical protein
MGFNIRDHVHNPDDPDLQDTYDAVDELVAKAGDVTIGQLFNATAEDIGDESWEAIRNAKLVGFMQMNNNGCCRNNVCEKRVSWWCSHTDDGRCSVLSDSCDR